MLEGGAAMTRGRLGSSLSRLFRRLETLCSSWPMLPRRSLLIGLDAV